MGAQDLELAQQAHDRTALEMGAAIHPMEAAQLPGLSPDEARAHREDAELYAYFARQHIKQVSPEALAAVLASDAEPGAARRGHQASRQVRHCTGCATPWPTSAAAPSCCRDCRMKAAHPAKMGTGHLPASAPARCSSREATGERHSAQRVSCAPTLVPTYRISFDNSLIHRRKPERSYGRPCSR